MTNTILFNIICSTVLLLGCNRDFQSNIEITNGEFLSIVEKKVSPLQYVFSSDTHVLKMEIDTDSMNEGYNIIICPYNKKMLSENDTSYFGACKIMGYYCFMYGVYSQDLMTITKEKTLNESLFNLNSDLLIEYDPLCTTFVYPTEW